MNEDTLKLILVEMKAIRDEMSQLRLDQQDRFENLETKLSRVESDVSSIKSSVERIEANTPQDIVALLKQINAKLDGNYDLASKVDDIETDLKLIKKVISNQ